MRHPGADQGAGLIGRPFERRLRGGIDVACQAPRAAGKLSRALNLDVDGPVGH
jgi:hypothetical protein